jgi:RNA-directed DNA polymerase
MKPSKTRLTHTLHVEAGEAGVDCWGVHIRPYPTPSKRGATTSITPRRAARARHQRPSGAVVRRHRMAPQARLRAAWKPVRRGWRPDYATLGRHAPFEPRAAQLRPHLRAWSRCRHPSTPLKWGSQQYWRGEAGQWPVKPRAQGKR